MKWVSAMQLGFEILADIEAIVTGQAASFTFVWHGKKFVVSVAPSSGGNP